MCYDVILPATAKKTGTGKTGTHSRQYSIATHINHAREEWIPQNRQEYIATYTREAVLRIRTTFDRIRFRILNNKKGIILDIRKI